MRAQHLYHPDTHASMAPRRLHPKTSLGLAVHLFAHTHPHRLIQSFLPNIPTSLDILTQMSQPPALKLPTKKPRTQ